MDLPSLPPAIKHRHPRSQIITSNSSFPFRKREQDLLKAQIIRHDLFEWFLPNRQQEREGKAQRETPAGDKRPLHRVAGVDVSFFKENNTEACAMLVVLEFPSMRVLYKDKEMVELKMPYISGFLAFREIPSVLALFNRLLENHPELRPDAILVDGNGELHHRGCGFASHLGILTDTPTIGVAKTLLAVDGLEPRQIHQRCRIECVKAGDFVELRGTSGRLWGVALKCTNDSVKPLFISVGHKISLTTAIDLVLRCCLYRIPSPIREADLCSRQFIREVLSQRREYQ